MNALVKRVGRDLTLVGKGGSNHWIPLDADEKLGGSGAATKPIELILIGLAGCTSMDVLSILKKMKVKLDDYELAIESERADEHPRVFTKINLCYRFYGDAVDETKVRKAIKLSEERYCGVMAMLRPTAKLETTYEIHPPR